MNASADRNGNTGRGEHIREIAARLHGLADPAEADGVVNALARVVADAVLTADGVAMETAASELRIAAGAWEDHGGELAAEWAEERGRLYGLVDVLRWVLQHRGAEAGASGIEPGSHAHRMLSLLVEEDGEIGEALNSGAIATRLGVDKTQVSRTGRDLIERGLAVTSALGRMTFWEITPRGQYALERLGAAAADDGDDAPLALALGAVTDARAEQVAAALTAQHGDVTAYVVSQRAGELAAASGSRRQAGPVVLIETSRRGGDWREDLERELAAGLPKAIARLAVVPASDDGRVRTVLPRTAAAARRRRKAGRPTAASARPPAVRPRATK